MRSFLPIFFFISLAWSLATPAADVDIDGELFLGVWSASQTLFETNVPVCVSDDGQGPFRVMAIGEIPDEYALTNDLGDKVEYRVFLHRGDNYNRRERLSPSEPSRRTYTATSNCQAEPAAFIRARVVRRDIDRAIPGIYQDTLVVMLSPL